MNIDPDGQFWQYVIGAAVGGFSGWLSGKAQGLKGWDMFDNMISGVAIGAITGGVGEGITAGFSLAAQSGSSIASVAAYGTAGAVSGALSGASMAAVTGGDIGKGALWGGVFGGLGGAAGGYLKHLQFESAVSNSSSYLAECKDCAAMFPGVSGTWLDPVYITGQRTLATGAVQPSYFFEELILGNGIGKLAGSFFGFLNTLKFGINSEAKLATNGIKLARRLASEAQMSEKGLTIIGPGKVRDAGRLAQQYGGKASDWVKKSSSSFTQNRTSFETHWYENIKNGLRTEYKTKLR